MSWSGDSAQSHVLWHPAACSDSIASRPCYTHVVVLSVLLLDESAAEE